MQEFDLTAFRAVFPQFDSLGDDFILAIADRARCFLSSYCKSCQQNMWQLLVAHMLTLWRQVSDNGGIVQGAVTSATIDKVSVSIRAPTTNDGWSFWLSLTPYGLELWALLNRCTAGGLYVGGLPERSAFRSVGGIFPNRGRVWR